MIAGNYGCKKQSEVQQGDVDVTTPAGGETTGGGLEGEGNSVDRLTGGVINRYVPPGGPVPPVPPGTNTNLIPPTVPVCGDSYVSLGVETCEDGNTVANDGCTNCQLDGPPGAPVCGNGIHEAGEQCDDGNVAANDSCTPTCQIDLSGLGGGGGSGTSTFPFPAPETNPGCATDAGRTNPLCAWTLYGAFGAIVNPAMLINFVGWVIYLYDDDGNPFEQVTANIAGEPVDIWFNVFDTENKPIFKQELRRANLSVPGPLSFLSLEFNKYLAGGADAGEIEEKFILTLDPNRPMMWGANPGPGLSLVDFAYNYNDPNHNFKPLITNTIFDFAASLPVPPTPPSPLATIQIIEGHQKDAQGRLERILKGFKDGSGNWIRFEETIISYFNQGLEIGKIQSIVMSYTNCLEDTTGQHCDEANLLDPLQTAHGVITSTFGYDTTPEVRLRSVISTEDKGPAQGQAVDNTVDKTVECGVVYWDNPHNIPIHRLPQFFKDLGFTDTGLVQGMQCEDTGSTQQTFGREVFFMAFIWKPLWTFIPSATIPQ